MLHTILASGATGSTFRHKRVGELGVLEIMHKEFDGAETEHATQILVTIACFFSTKLREQRQMAYPLFLTTKCKL